MNKEVDLNLVNPQQYNIDHTTNRHRKVRKDGFIFDSDCDDIVHINSSDKRENSFNTQEIKLGFESSDSNQTITDITRPFKDFNNMIQLNDRTMSQNFLGTYSNRGELINSSLSSIKDNSKQNQGTISLREKLQYHQTALKKKLGEIGNKT